MTGKKRRNLVVFLSVLILALALWRLLPRSFSRAAKTDTETVASAAGSYSEFCWENGEWSLETGNLGTISQGDEKIGELFEILDSTEYRPSFSNLLPWNMTGAENDSTATVVITYTWGAEDYRTLFLYSNGKMEVFGTSAGNKTLVYHFTDTELTECLENYIKMYGEEESV